MGSLGTAHVHMQIDIGFGDVVHPEPIEAELPTILDSPVPRLLYYSLESAIAEKFEAICILGPCRYACQKTSLRRKPRVVTTLNVKRVDQGEKYQTIRVLLDVVSDNYH